MPMRVNGRRLNRRSKLSKLKKKRSWDTSGGLEGLPLQLIIMMVIAGIAIGIVISWLTVFSEKPLKELEVTGITPVPTKGNRILTNGVSYMIEITALNSDRKPMKDVTVFLEGPGISKIATTDSDGRAAFTDVIPDLGTNEEVGLISVSGKHKSWSVTGAHIGIER
ncbi:MAG: hypothetical protein KAI64_05015 [Thermoplasmata archaeon]|nr:hypothetical protein [Thermoplasmata archaeon]